MVSRRGFGTLVWLLLASASGCGQSAPPPPAVAAPAHAVSAGEVQAGEADATPTLTSLITYRGDVRRLPASATVYVFARRAGTTMPLAVERFEPAALPRTVEFGGPDGKVGAVELVARLSVSGDVHLGPGDSEIVSAPQTFGSPVTVPLALPEIGSGAGDASPAGLAIDWDREGESLGAEPPAP